MGSLTSKPTATVSPPRKLPPLMLTEALGLSGDAVAVSTSVFSPGMTGAGSAFEQL